MGNNNFYTKGEKEEVVSRIGQVHTITLFCPMSDFCIQSLKSSFDMMLPKYKTSDNRWDGVPAIDALNVFLFTTSFLNTAGLDVDRNIFSIVVSSLKMFKKLKKINFEVTEDEEIKGTYDMILKKINPGPKRSIYQRAKLFKF